MEESFLLSLGHDKDYLQSIKIQIGKSKHFVASNVCVLVWGEFNGKSYLIKMAITPLIMVQFSKFNLYLKLDIESYKSLPAISICELDKNSLGFIGFAHSLLIIAQPHAELFKGASYVAIFRHVRRRMEMHMC